MAQLGRLTRDDVEQAAALSRGAGWNQTREDWARLVDLAPDGVFGAFDEGRLVATSSVVVYGEALAWIGMMLVDVAHRGRGLGKALLDAALAAPSVRPCAVVALDATDMGRPLYETRGFVAVEPIDRWGGTLQPTATRPGTEVRTIEVADAASVATWDAGRTGVARGGLVTHLLASPGVHGWWARRGRAWVGYAVVRPGRTHHHLGPLVADDADAFEALVGAVARGLAGAPVFVDVPRGGATDTAFADAGLRVERRLTRMTRARPTRVLSGPPVWAAAALEWG